MNSQDPSSDPGQSDAWKQKVDDHQRQEIFGARQRLQLLSGSACFLFGLLTFVMPMAEDVYPGWRETFAWTRWLGLLIGLTGAGLIARSLRHVRQASLISGVGAAFFLLTTFGVSLWVTRLDSVPAAERNSLTDRVQETMSRNSWMRHFPSWLPASHPEWPQLSPAADWQRAGFDENDYSALFPQTPERLTHWFELKRSKVNQTTLVTQVGGIEFQLQHYESEGPVTPQEIVDNLEEQVGLGRRVSDIRQLGLSWRSLLKVDGSDVTQMWIHQASNHVIVLCLAGPTMWLPGEVGDRFLESFQQSPQRTVGRQRNRDWTPAESQFELLRPAGNALHDLMRERISSESVELFPAPYLTRGLGVLTGQRVFLAHPEKRPVVGLQVVLDKTPRGETVLLDLVPFYDHKQAPTSQPDVLVIQAREGYGVAGLRVNTGRGVKGVQLIFAPITARGFAIEESYSSDWLGVATRDGQTVGGKGWPVYGFWFSRDETIRAIGLIQEQRR